MESKEYTGVKVVMDGMHFEANKVPVESIIPILALWRSAAETRCIAKLQQEHLERMERNYKENTPVAAGACSASE
jgi:hypothetical protein